ncbi:unnamed protein product [Staurois parvus]|uniref:Uncharacterized protein n=1 Tax=Staurois parvus TaxID=386267 RepID=A0ABN9GFS4_9NEOB|nr:unnamed protein product [Staurois parvus]
MYINSRMVAVQGRVAIHKWHLAFWTVRTPWELPIAVRDLCVRFRLCDH